MLAESPKGIFSDTLDADQYDCVFTFKPLSSLKKTSKILIKTEWDGDDSYIALLIKNQSMLLSAVLDGKSTVVATIPMKVQPGIPINFTVLRRGKWIGIEQEQRLLYRGEVVRGTGKYASLSVEDGWAVTGASVLPREAVAFADDFMRTTDEIGPWTVQSGQWSLQSAWDDVPHGNINRFADATYAQNPFSWAGVGTKNIPALCTTGPQSWDHYTVTASICPGESTAVGLQVNMPNENDGIRIRWSPGNDRSTTGNALAVYQVLKGKTTLLARDAGGFIPGQWYRIAVASTADGVRVSIDGRERLVVPLVMPWRGGIGLYAEGNNRTVFDDITVYGKSLRTDLLLESRQSRINERFLDDEKGLMQQWATNRFDWEPVPGIPETKRYRRTVYGDHWLSLSVTPMEVSSGTLALTLCGDENSSTQGYRAIAQATGGKIIYTLFRNNELLLEKSTPPLPTGTCYRFALRRTDGKINMDIDDESVLEATDSAPLAGGHPSYTAVGCFADTADAMVLGHQILDYSFSEAQVDWLADGTWKPSIRWACSPKWSFLAGWSRGDAVLWHKYRFIGDQTLQAFLGLQMEYPRERAVETERMRDFAITICGDGHNPRTGYTGIFAASSASDRYNRKIVLLRNGIEVAAVPLPAYDDFYNYAHQDWFELELRKRDHTIEFWTEGKSKPTLTYIDPNPISGGVPAIWTTDNGISLARVRLFYANRGEACRKTSVILANPWYPEWANVGEPITLDFSNSWSTTGTPVHLTAQTRDVPKDAPGKFICEGKIVTFTAERPDEHWYQVRAMDAMGHTSAPFELSLPAFSPALGRDDSHALVLYRFNEGKGYLVHDQSRTTPPADIAIPAKANTRWIPQHGLSVHGTTPLMTAHGIKKLAEIVKTKQFTVECWVSSETVAPPDVVAACIVGWERSERQQNFAFGQRWYNFYFTPNGRGNISNGVNAVIGDHVICPWLQHLVVTCDGNTIRGYVNGEQSGESSARKINFAKWDTDAPLVLGNHSFGSGSYFGTYYLLAIHDRALSDDTVKRHYDAGPSAR